MKAIKKLKLTRLSLEELEKREMNSLMGGTNSDSSCNCNCATLQSKGATMNANSAYGYQHSYGGDYGGTVTCTCEIKSMVSTRSGI